MRNIYNVYQTISDNEVNSEQMKILTAELHEVLKNAAIIHESIPLRFGPDTISHLEFILTDPSTVWNGKWLVNLYLNQNDFVPAIAIAFHLGTNNHLKWSDSNARISLDIKKITDADRKAVRNALKRLNNNSN